MKGATELHELERENVRKMKPEAREKALQILRDNLLDAVKAKVKEAYKKEPDDWWVSYHFSWGMGVRNLLRQKGASEKELGIDNLDDYYIVLVEQALGLEDLNGPISG